MNIASIAHIGDIFELDSGDKAISIPHWYDVMSSKISSIEENNTWQLVPHPLHKKFIGVKWIFKENSHYDGSLDKYKAQLVAKGYDQKEGENYDETFAPTARFTTICLVFAIQGCTCTPYGHIRTTRYSMTRTRLYDWYGSNGRI